MSGEQITVTIISAIVLVPLIVISIVLLNGKGAFLIAGYNTTSKEKKNKINEKALCKFIGLMLLFLVVFIATLILGALLGNVPLMIVGGSLFGAVTIFTLLFANTKRFKNKS